ncbi:hypothetical protein ERJ75_001072600 [Trypanosoma vivax]|nr:hypothetical protein ERJ75_001072600 [Trypanosoma vivax]
MGLLPAACQTKAAQQRREGLHQKLSEQRRRMVLGRAALKRQRAATGARRPPRPIRVPSPAAGQARGNSQPPPFKRPAAKLERDRQITQKHGGPWATACGMLSKGPPGGNFDGARRCVCPRAADQLLAERKMSKSDSAAAPSPGQSVTHPLAPWLSKRAPLNGSKIRGGRRELLRAKSRPRGRPAETRGV